MCCCDTSKVQKMKAIHNIICVIFSCCKHNKSRVSLQNSRAKMTLAANN